MEGVVLYIMLVVVFAHVDWKYYTGFILMSYGKATVTVCISYSVEISTRWSITVYGIVYSIGTGKNR